MDEAKLTSTLQKLTALPKGTAEAQTVSYLILGLLIAQAVQPLKYEGLEDKNRVERPATGIVFPVAVYKCFFHGGAEHLEINNLIKLFLRIAQFHQFRH